MATRILRPFAILDPFRFALWKIFGKRWFPWALPRTLVFVYLVLALSVTLMTCDSGLILIGCCKELKNCSLTCTQVLQVQELQAYQNVPLTKINIIHGLKNRRVDPDQVVGLGQVSCNLSSRTRVSQL